MFRDISRLAIICLSLAAPGAALAQAGAPPAAPLPAPLPDLPYAFHADLVGAAPVIADVTVRSATQIKGPEAAAVPPGMARFYVVADVAALLRGQGGLPPRIGYLVDVAPGPDGRLPRLKKARMLVFARAVPGSPDQVQLVSPDAQLAWTPDEDALTRDIARALVAPDAPPRVTGVASAFHVPGSLPGEGETQVFLTTANGRPVSLSILRRPGEEPHWAVALSEIVDEAAVPPARRTLLWYRLACFLPGNLPEASTASLGAEDAAAAREDYRFVLQQLGACGRRAGVGPVSDGDAPA